MFSRKTSVDPFQKDLHAWCLIVILWIWQTKKQLQQVDKTRGPWESRVILSHRTLRKQGYFKPLNPEKAGLFKPLNPEKQGYLSHWTLKSRLFKPLNPEKQVFKPLNPEKQVFKPMNPEKQVFKPMNPEKQVFKPMNAENTGFLKPLNSEKQGV